MGTNLSKRIFPGTSLRKKLYWSTKMSSKSLPAGLRLRDLSDSRSRQAQISVIMSVYNGMPHLKDAVKSILGQTYKNIEFIIVDDGSTDNSWQYLKSLKDPRVKLIKNKKNLGLAKSLNIALRQVFDSETQTESAQGDFIARMDADDICYPERMDTQLKFLKKNPDIDLCGSWVTLINNKGEKIGANRKNPTDDKNIKKLLGIRPTIIHPTFFGKKDFFLHSGGYKNEFDGAEEYELLCRAKNKFTYANIPKELIYWRLRDERRSMQMMDKMYDLDIKIKKKNLTNDGFNFYNLYGYSKILVLHYLIPLPLKKKIARFLKIA